MMMIIILINYFGGLIVLCLASQVGTHDKLGMQVVPLRLLNPQETKVLKLNLVKNMNPNDPHNKKSRGQLEVELTYKPFKDDNGRCGAHLLDANSMIVRDNVGKSSKDMPLNEAGLLMVTVQGAENVEGKYHSSNPYALVCFGGERKQTKVMVIIIMIFFFSFKILIRALNSYTQASSKVQIQWL